MFSVRKAVGTDKNDLEVLSAYCDSCLQRLLRKFVLLTQYSLYSFSKCSFCCHEELKKK